MLYAESPTEEIDCACVRGFEVERLVFAYDSSWEEVERVYAEAQRVNSLMWQCLQFLWGDRYRCAASQLMEILQ